MNSALADMLTQAPDALVTRFNDLSFDPSLATEALVSQNLFGGGNIVVFEGILDTEEGETFYKTTLPTTQNTVLIRETEISKEFLPEFKKMAEIIEFAAVKAFKKPENSFALSDAIGARDKKATWVEFEKIRRRGGAMEEVHGTIFWAFKSLYVAATATKEDALQSGMKEYTYRTNLNFSKKYLVPELKTKLGELKDMYHQAHRGECDLEAELELFLLRL